MAETRPGGGERIVCIGHSHVKALADARLLLPGGGANVEVIAFWTEPEALIDGGFSVSARERLGRADRVLACMGGSAHTVVGLVEHARRFDVALDIALDGAGPPGLDLAPDPARELVPLQGVRAAVAAMDAPYVALLAALKASCAAPVVQLGAPPPVRDAARIAPHVPWSYYPGQPHEVAPAALRWKLWRIQSRVMEDACARLDCGYAPPPVDAFGPDGFLRPDLDRDGVHTTAAYGLLALRALGAAP